MGYRTVRGEEYTCDLFDERGRPRYTSDAVQLAVFLLSGFIGLIGMIILAVLS